MEKFVEQGYLYDFYGELLTERQQQVYESVVLEDYSLSEVCLLYTSNKDYKQWSINKDIQE